MTQTTRKSINTPLLRISGRDSKLEISKISKNKEKEKITDVVADMFDPKRTNTYNYSRTS